MRLMKYPTSDNTGWCVSAGDVCRDLGVGSNGEIAARSLLLGETSVVDGPKMVAPSLLLPPIMHGGTVYGVGLNYLDHVQQTKREVPAYPVMFIRPTASLVGHGESMEVPVVSGKLDYEGEVAVVIGRGGRNISREQALSHIAGLTCFNDGSLRDHQLHSLAAGKSFHRAGACGPGIATVDEVRNLASMDFRTILNGQVVQQSNTKHLIYPIDLLVSYLSDIVVLRTGDIIATGTPAGTGRRRDPPLWMKPGDRVVVEIDGVGELANSVCAQQHR